MIALTIIVALLLIFVGVAGLAYSIARGAGWPHHRAALAGYATTPATFAGLLLLAGQPDMLTGLGWLLGAFGLCGCAWWLWQRTPVQPAGQPQTGDSWVPAQESRAAQLRAGMTRKVEWTVEEL